jgi:16S rRNA (adenine1518-N6/adenine1519-N6)-dimethyltransferase
MTYSNKQELIALLQKHGLYAQKRLGQNFLIDQTALAKIVDAANLTSSDFVVEIGPGLGVLTAELVKKAGNVLSIELDARLIPILKENIPAGNLEIINADALQMPLPDIAYKLVANIPYYITSPILNHFLQPKTPTEKRPTLIVLLVQKEVAEKVCALPSDHSVLSLQVQVFGKPEIVGKVSASSFFPAPDVDSAILRITPRAEPAVKDTALFFRLIHATFAQRRKTLSNSLQNGLGKNKEEITAALSKAGIKPTARPQELSLPDWQRLIDAWA